MNDGNRHGAARVRSAKVHEVERRGLAAWRDAPIAALVEHITLEYHRPLPFALGRLQQLSTRAAARHLELVGLADCCAALARKLAPHLRMEELLLFPRLSAGRPVSRLVTTVVGDHHEVIAELDAIAAFDPRLRELARSCSVCAELAHLLVVLERSLLEHFTLEELLYERAGVSHP